MGNIGSITIVSCFYNSAHRLDRYMQSIAALERGTLDVEVLLIDNASSDDTHRMLGEVATRYGVKDAHVIEERTSGLMYAKAAGVERARGEVVIFFDDDNFPASNYLLTAIRILEEHRDVRVLSGNAVLPGDYDLSPVQRSVAFLMAVREIEGEFRVRGTEIFPPGAPHGAGMVAYTEDLRRACREWRRRSTFITGRRGNTVASGEDIWLGHYLTTDGGCAFFSDKLRLVHGVDISRFTVDYVLRLAFQNGMERPLLEREIKSLKPSARIGRVRGRIGAIYLVSKILASLLLAAFRPRLRPLARLATNLGLMWGLLAAGQLVPFDRACGTEEK